MPSLNTVFWTCLTSNAISCDPCMQWQKALKRLYKGEVGNLMIAGAGEWVRKGQLKAVELVDKPCSYTMKIVRSSRRGPCTRLNDSSHHLDHLERQCVTGGHIEEQKRRQRGEQLAASSNEAQSSFLVLGKGCWFGGLEYSGCQDVLVSRASLLLLGNDLHKVCSIQQKLSRSRCIDSQTPGVKLGSFHTRRWPIIMKIQSSLNLCEFFIMSPSQSTTESCWMSESMQNLKITTVRFLRQQWGKWAGKYM